MLANELRLARVFDGKASQLALCQFPAGLQLKRFGEVCICTGHVTRILFGNRAVVIGRKEVDRFEFNCTDRAVLKRRQSRGDKYGAAPSLK